MIPPDTTDPDVSFQGAHAVTIKRYKIPVKTSWTSIGQRVEGLCRLLVLDAYRRGVLGILRIVSASRRLAGYGRSRECGIDAEKWAGTMPVLESSISGRVRFLGCMTADEDDDSMMDSGGRTPHTRKLAELWRRHICHTEAEYVDNPRAEGSMEKRAAALFATLAQDLRTDGTVKLAFGFSSCSDESTLDAFAVTGKAIDSDLDGHSNEQLMELASEFQLNSSRNISANTSWWQATVGLQVRLGLPVSTGIGRTLQTATGQSERERLPWLKDIWHQVY